MTEAKKQIQLNDVCLRESAQVSGGAMSPGDQLTYVRYLLEGGIDRIEIGFPGSSKVQLENCGRIVDFVNNNAKGKRPLLGGLARAKKEDIDAIKEAGCDLCHIYIPASPDFVKAMFAADKYGDTVEGKQNWTIDQAGAMVAYAKSLGFKSIEYSPEDAARTSREFLYRMVGAVISAGADVVNIPDTTGLRVGNEFGDLIALIEENVPNRKNALISIHCHNDSDHGTHNALQAVLNGADIIEGTFFGLGERSGMTKLEAIIMNMHTRQDMFGDFKIDFKPELCVKIVSFIANALGMNVPRHWVVVGAQNSICSSGTHQAIEARAREQGMESAYYSWHPETYGHAKVTTVINQSSGREGLRIRLEELGYALGKEELQKIYSESVKISEAMAGKPLSDRELAAIVHETIDIIPFPIKVKRCQAIGGEGSLPTATVVVEIDGKESISASVGVGPYDAIMHSVIRAAEEFYPELKKVKISLNDWRPVAVSSGSDALADVYGRIRINNDENHTFSGRAVHIDTNQASAQAFANCLSWYLASL
ncbi:MAG: alpha-isopropylmalate synthase regulatory domain-containing protein [Patescibacteria group bacterium]|jgi:2-isopropylmalate synthase